MSLILLALTSAKLVTPTKKNFESRCSALRRYFSPRLLNTPFQEEDGQTDRQTDGRTDRRPKVREIQTTSSSSWNVLGENNVFLVGVTNLAPPLALIKIRTEQLLSLIFQLTSFVYFCKYQTTKERDPEINRSTDQPDRKRSTARATVP